VDYAIIPPVMYVDLQMSSKASKMLTLADKNRVEKFGSVIITRKDSDINELSQIQKHHRIAAVAPLGTGGWLIGYDTLRKHHIDPLENGNRVVFTGSHIKVAKAVLENKADIGVIRTGFLEKWQEEKKIDIQKFRVLNQQNYSSFPYMCSSKLYPEWVLAKTPNAFDELSRQIVIELLTLSNSSNIAGDEDYLRWTVPANYSSIYDLIERLEVSHRENMTSEIIRKWLKEHSEELYFIILLIFAILIIFLVHEFNINKRLSKEKNEKEELLKQIEFHAYHDTLTNLFNRTYLEDITKSQNKFSIILLDINNLSYINMAYGFEAGDKLLLEISKILKNMFNAHSVYRLNSDEFALLYDKKIDLEAQIKHIQNYFHSNIIQIEDITLHISFSYGAAYNKIQNAALALRQARENGKDRFVVFDEERDAIDYKKRKEFIESHNLLCKAFEEDKIIPYFQGIRDNKNEEITKFEVLARIEQDGKIISPYRFLEVAKLTGFIPNITKAMIDKSFKIMADYDYTFSINITEDDLNKDYLCDYLDKKSMQYGINPERVIIEILEGISSSGQKNNLEQLKFIKSRGYALAIDDFGAEYSNFERTLDLNIDFIKIDAKYIKDIDVNPRSYNVAKSIVFFAKQSGIACVAEFVHNASVQKIVEELGIEFSQGYYFSEPSSQPA